MRTKQLIIHSNLSKMKTKFSQPVYKETIDRGSLGEFLNMSYGIFTNLSMCTTWHHNFTVEHFYNWKCLGVPHPLSRNPIFCISLLSKSWKKLCSAVFVHVPVYSGKHMVSGDFSIFSANRSFLFKKRMIDVSVNHLLLQMESNSFMLSIIRF